MLLDTATPYRPPGRRDAAAPFRDWLTMSGRSLRMSRRNIEGLMTSVAAAGVLMLIFVYLFGGAIHTGTAYVTYVVPGVLVCCARIRLRDDCRERVPDMTTGIIDRFRSMDVSGAAVLAGHVVASVARNAVSTALVLGVALLIGFRPHAMPFAGSPPPASCCCSFSPSPGCPPQSACFAKSPEAANGFTFLAQFLPYPSSAFVPIPTMPIWIRGFAPYQPVTPVIQSIRGLLLVSRSARSLAGPGLVRRHTGCLYRAGRPALPAPHHIGCWVRRYLDAAGSPPDRLPHSPTGSIVRRVPTAPLLDERPYSRYGRQSCDH